MSIFSRDTKKHGRQHYIEYRHAGKRIREKVGPNRREAEILLAERLQDIRMGRNPALRVIKPRLFKVVMEEFEAKYVSLRRDPKSYMDRTKVIVRAFEGMTLQEITSKAIEDFLSDRRAVGSSGPTCNRLRAVLSKIFNWSIDRGYFGGENPARKVKRSPERPGRTRFLTAEEAEKLIEKAPKHLKPIIICALHTGGRRREILTLRPEDVDLERRVLYFDQTNTKSGKQREIPIDDVLYAVLKERLKVRSIASPEFVFTWRRKPIKDLRTAFDKARVGAGLGPEVTFHILRHTFASWFMINGGDPYRLQKYLGHSTMKLTERYSHLSPEHLQAGAAFFGPPREARDEDGPSLAPGSSEAKVPKP